MEAHRRPLIAIESHIPFIGSRLDAIADVRRLSPEEFTREAVADADGIIVRTRTRVDSALLEGSKVRFVATATIGTDHLDLPWLERAGIKAVNAPGCNAPAVAQYVLASALTLGYQPGAQTTLGIVGVGHVGKVVERWARGLGMTVMLCDPPRAEAEGPDGFSTLSDIAAQADIITFHTPLTASGPYPSRHLISAEFLDACRRHPLIINAARGPVADTDALIDAISKDKIARPVIDCWEGEPNISPTLLDVAAIATPHIAGYSLEGKMRATEMTLQALTEFFHLPPAAPLDGEPDLTPAITPSAEAITASYDPLADTAILRQSPVAFEAIRNGYNYRHEPRG